MPGNADKAASVPLVLKPSAIIRVLIAVAILLILASIAGQLMKYFAGHPNVHGLVPFFYVEEERNAPTFFSGLLLMLAALLLAFITALRKKQGDPDASRWLILAFGFLYMAGDELLSFHEKLIMPVRHLIPEATHGIFRFAWVIPAIAVVIVLALYFLKFLLRLPAQTRLTFLMAATLYLGGAIGGELVEGWYLSSHTSEDFTFSMIATTEESLEMAGVIVFIYALLRYIAVNYNEVRFRIADSKSF